MKFLRGMFEAFGAIIELVFVLFFHCLVAAAILFTADAMFDADSFQFLIGVASLFITMKLVERTHQ